ncbi:hypothetical protein SERLA73DRAFT_90724 [Serpula lacrymans var. lacrymans S7.3]|uniref:FAD-binding domain-containing protein n=1 Tax=Serpula lacrymans var. lacrymans (strain S7.3) TaxID=936435 RepID=F8PX95_SERL3|nr:hypothetical protein SERLA73DRAFT_90724 [Serpula lacrymans var. lacrymans S7.3]
MIIASLAAQSPSVPTQASLSIDFLVVGGGIGGLACAIALRRVGHRVLVLEKAASAGSQISGGIRLPPNVSKILFHWGLEAELRKISLTSEAIQLNIYESGEILGTHFWEEEVLKETGGEYLFLHHADLQRLLHNTALSFGAKIRNNATVALVDGDDCHVTLSTGEILRADAIIGADGRSSIIQREIVGHDVYNDTPHRFVMYNTVVPGHVMRANPDLIPLYEEKHTTLFCWFGDGRAAMGFRIKGGTDDYALHFWVPPGTQEGGEDVDSWGSKVSVEEMLKQIQPCEPRLKKMVLKAAPPALIKVKALPALEDWVHDEGRLALIGEAAHPIPVGAIQAAAMAVEDGAVLAKLFSHLGSQDQISSFLYAYQDLREVRCASVVTSEQENLAFQTLPKGEMQEARDNGMRAKYAAGQSVLGGGEAADQWESLKDLFGYDAEDQADDWWVKWGILRERAKQSSIDQGLHSGMNNLAL